MPDTLLVEKEASSSSVTLPAWVGDLTPTQRRDIRGCIPFPLKALEDGSGWAWHAERPNQTVAVKFGAKKNFLVITVSDNDAGEVIELWTTELHLTGQWKQRLRQSSGESMVLGQSRLRCPKCGAYVKIRRRREDNVQFFGCTKYPTCHGSLNITDHDVEHPS